MVTVVSPIVQQKADDPGGPRSNDYAITVGDCNLQQLKVISTIVNVTFNFRSVDLQGIMPIISLSQHINELTPLRLHNVCAVKFRHDMKTLLYNNETRRRRQERNEESRRKHIKLSLLKLCCFMFEIIIPSGRART